MKLYSNIFSLFLFVIDDHLPGVLFLVRYFSSKKSRTEKRRLQQRDLEDLEIKDPGNEVVSVVGNRIWLQIIKFNWGIL
jgi:hypothetical protein